MTPAAAPDDKARWIKAINDQNRMQPAGGVQLTVTPEGKLNFMGNPAATKQGRALQATLDEALKAGATVQEIAASLNDAKKPAQKPLPIKSTLPDKALPAPTTDIKAITAKQIPDMTDAELQQAATHYGPEHARTAKITKEVNRRALVAKLKAPAAPPPAPASAADADQPGKDWSKETPEAIASEMDRLQNHWRATKAKRDKVHIDSEEAADLQRQLDRITSQTDKLYSMLPEEEAEPAPAEDEEPEAYTPPANWRESNAQTYLYAGRMGIERDGLDQAQLLKAIDKALKAAAKVAAIAPKAPEPSTAVAVSNQRNMPNMVVMGVRDRDGNKLGDILEKHDGTKEGIHAAGVRAFYRMDDEFSGEGSGIQSLIGATDENGKPAWAVFPQAKAENRVLPIDSRQARGMWGDTDALMEEFVAQTADKKPETLPNATAPEHVTAGVDDRELDQIVSEFNNAQAAMVEGDEKVTHIFDAPAKGEIVRLADKAKVYHKDHGWMTVAQAKARVDEWKAHAAAQGTDPKTRSANSQKVVLSLFDLTGSWSQPWEDAGYQVYRFDIQDDPEVGDVNNFSTDFFGDWFGDFDGMDIHAILAATPCTDFAVSGARHFAAKDKDGRTVASVKLVHQTLATIEYFKPAVWALENPVGRIERLGGLPPWRLSFDPNQLGDPYTKKTILWGRFNADLPIAPVEPTEGSKMHKLYGGKSQATKNARSETPEGFAYGFFMANNAIDNPVMAVANKYDRLDRDLIAKAIEAGATEQQIDDAVEDSYYQDLDDEAGNEALRGLGKVSTPAISSDKPAGMTVTFDGKNYPVASIEDAQDKWNEFRDTSGGGVSNVGNGVVVKDASGEILGTISYNGRFWKKQPAAIAPPAKADIKTVAPKVSSKEAARALRETETATFTALVNSPELVGQSIEDLTAALAARVPGSKPDQLAKMAAELRKQLAKNAAELAKAQHRRPEVYKAAVDGALLAAGIENDADKTDRFQAGWAHALAGKTKSTMSGDMLADQVRGYEGRKSLDEDRRGCRMVRGPPGKQAAKHRARLAPSLGTDAGPNEGGRIGHDEGLGADRARHWPG